MKNILSPEEQAKIETIWTLDQAIRSIRADWERAAKENKKVWGDFRINLLKKARLEEQAELIAYWNLY